MLAKKTKQHWNSNITGINWQRNKSRKIYCHFDGERWEDERKFKKWKWKTRNYKIEECKIKDLSEKQ